MADQAPNIISLAGRGRLVYDKDKRGIVREFTPQRATDTAVNPARAAIDRYFSDKNDGLVAWLAEAKPAVTVAAHFLVWLRSNGFVVVPCLPPAAA